MSKSKIDRQIELPPELIKKLLTSSEWRMIKQRFLVISLIEEGLSIRNVAKKACVGTDTVMRMLKKLSDNPDIKKLLKKDVKKVSSSKWVFGQIDSKE